MYLLNVFNCVLTSISDFLYRYFPFGLYAIREPQTIFSMAILINTELRSYSNDFSTRANASITNNRLDL